MINLISYKKRCKQKEYTSFFKHFLFNVLPYLLSTCYKQLNKIKIKLSIHYLHTAEGMRVKS